MTNVSSYFRLENFLSQKEKTYFLSFIDRKDFIQHRSSLSGELSSLQFFPVTFRNFSRVSLMKMNPFAKQDWHTDSKSLKRGAVIIHPISDNYAPCLTLDGEVTFPAILNTQSRHAVFNNQETRLNLQITLDVDFIHLIENPSAPAWKLIESL